MEWINYQFKIYNESFNTVKEWFLNICKHIQWRNIPYKGIN